MTRGDGKTRGSTGDGAASKLGLIMMTMIGRGTRDRPQAKEVAKEVAESLPLGIHRAAEALEPLPPIDWIVEGLLSSSSTSIFCGDSGIGKSYTMFDLAVCVAAGQDWLGHKVTRGSVLLVDEENGDRRMRRRLAQVMRGHDVPADIPLYWISFAGIDLRTSKGTAILRSAVKYTETRLVILDSMMDFTPGADENSVKDLQPAYHAMRLIADEYSCHVSGIHHFNKAGKFRGSSAIKGLVDLMVNVTEYDGVLKFRDEKVRDVEDVRFSAELNWGDGTFSLSRKRSAADEQAAFNDDVGKTLAHIAGDGGIGQNKLIEAACQALPQIGKNAMRKYIKGSVGEWLAAEPGGPGKITLYYAAHPLVLPVRTGIVPVVPVQACGPSGARGANQYGAI